MTIASRGSLEDMALDHLINSGGNRFIAIREMMEYIDKKEAIHIVNQVINEVEKYSAKGEITFKEFSEIWVNDYARVRLKKSTFTSHMRNLKKNLQYFDHLSLNQITKHIIQNWISVLCEDLTPKTVKNNYSLLHQILDQAVAWDYLTSNPAAGVVLPKQEKKEAQYYDRENVEKLLLCLENVPDLEYDKKVAILLALFAGLRKGEICGLNYEDIDFINSRIHIRRNRMTNKGEGIYEDSPKTEQSVRVLTLSSGIMEEIKKLEKFQDERKKEYGDAWVESPAVLKNLCGSPLYPQSLYRWFKEFQRKNDLPDLSLHGLRHTHTAMLVDLGTNIEAVSHRLGHGSTTITLGTYSHLFQPGDEEIAEALNDYLKNE